MYFYHLRSFKLNHCFLLNQIKMYLIISQIKRFISTVEFSNFFFIYINLISPFNK